MVNLIKHRHWYFCGQKVQKFIVTVTLEICFFNTGNLSKYKIDFETGHKFMGELPGTSPLQQDAGGARTF